MNNPFRSTPLPLLLSCAILFATPCVRVEAQDNSYKPAEILVKYKSAATEGQMFAFNLKWGGKLLKKFRSIGWQQVRLASNASIPQIVALYKSNPLVESVEPNYKLRMVGTPNDPSYPTQWDMAKIQAPTAWNKTTGSSDVVVAVIDTGVDYTHSDLAANMWHNPNETAGNGIDDDGDGYVDDVYGIDAANDDGDPMDDVSHGTHCAGSIGAVGNNGVGIAGVNWNVKIMALKFMDSNGDGYTSDAIDCLNYTVLMKQRGVNVVATSNSWSGGSFSVALQSAFTAAEDAGILNAVAAGNEGRNLDFQPAYPASYSNAGIIAVAASDSSDKRPSWSNYGAKNVDLAAPGANIYSTIPGGYATYSGTSMATPHVAGAIALLAAYSGSSSTTQIKSALLKNVDVIKAWKGKVVSGGRLNLAKAINALAPTVPPANYQADLTIRNSNEGTTSASGNNIYNADGTNQNRAQTVANNTTATYFVNVQNDGTATDTFAVNAPATPTGSNAEYFEDSSNTNITTAIKSSNGWSTPSLAASATVALRVEVTPGANAPSGSNFAAIITAASKSDVTKKDTVRATTSTPAGPAPVYGVDAAIRNFADVAFVGEGVINTNASNQTTTQSAPRSATAVYLIRLQNSGSTPDTIKLKGGSGNLFWTVTFFDDITNANITSAVQKGSWVTPQLAAGGDHSVRLEVKSSFLASVNSSFGVQMTATSTASSSKVDSVKATTTVSSGSAASKSDNATAQTVTANAQGRYVTLYFGNAGIALDKTSAIDTSHYTIALSGQELEIHNAQYEESSGVVLLETSGRALQIVPKLTVSFHDLSTLAGATISGSATVTK